MPACPVESVRLPETVVRCTGSDRSVVVELTQVRVSGLGLAARGQPVCLIPAQSRQ